MARPAPTEPLDALRERIRAGGLRATGARIAVLRRLQAATAPLSHGEFAEQLATEGLDRATIYRNLTDLVEAGLVRRVDLGDHVWRFELLAEGGAHERGAHAHFVCNACGDVVCLPEDSVRIKARGGVPRALQSRGVEIQLKGRCDRCA